MATNEDDTMHNKHEIIVQNHTKESLLRCGDRGSKIFVKHGVTESLFESILQNKKRRDI